MANQKESKLLCIDTSSGVDSLALTKGLEVIATNQAQHTREQRPFLLSNLQTLCSDAGWQWRDLEGVAVGLGPGGFTRLRSGLSVAKSLAFALDIPIFGGSSLVLLAQQQEHAKAFAITDAGRSEVYFIDSNGQLHCDRVQELAHILDQNEEYFFCGSGARANRNYLLERFPRAVVNEDADQDLPNAAYLPKVIDLESPAPIGSLEPQYVRPSDAELTYPDGFPDAATQFNF